MTDEVTLQDAYNEFEQKPEPTREERMLAALSAIGRVVFPMPEGQERTFELADIVQGVTQLVVSERRLRKALQRLLDSRVSGTVAEQTKAQEGGRTALRESLREVFGAQKEAAQALNPDAGHGAADGFGGSDFD